MPACRALHDELKDAKKQGSATVFHAVVRSIVASLGESRRMCIRMFAASFSESVRKSAPVVNGMRRTKCSSFKRSTIRKK